MSQIRGDDEILRIFLSGGRELIEQVEPKLVLLQETSGPQGTVDPDTLNTCSACTIP